MATATMDLELVDDSDTLIRTFSVAFANLAGTVAPTAAADDSAGYNRGSIWIDATHDKAYICVDNTSSVAVWKEIGAGGSPGGSTTQLQYNNGGVFAGTAGVGFYNSGILQGTNGTGTNAAGTTFTVGGGQGTGTGKGGDFQIQTSAPGTAGSSTNKLTDREVWAANSKALTSGTAVGLFSVNLPAGKVAGGSVRAVVRVTDGTDYQVITEFAMWAAFSKAGSITAAIGTNGNNIIKSTLANPAYSWTADTSVANTVTFKLSVTTSLAATTFDVYFVVESHDEQDITIL